MDGEVLDGAIGEAMSKLPTLRLANDDSEEKDSDLGDEGYTAKISRRCAAVDGFSIHANTAVAAPNRLGLEKLLSQCAPPFPTSDSVSPRGASVLYTLRRLWPAAGGVSALCFTPIEFLRRLSQLIPPPYAHLIQYFGLFAPNAKYRDFLPAAPVTDSGIRPEAFIRGKGRPTSLRWGSISRRSSTRSGPSARRGGPSPRRP